MKKLLILFLLWSATASAQVIFIDNFDNHADYSTPEQQFSAGADTSDSSGNATTRCTTCPTDGAVYSGTFTQRAAWPDYRGNRGIIISSANARGGSGKAATMWHEPIDTISCDGGTYWCSGQILAATFSESHPAVYVQFYVQFQSGWVWPDDRAGQMKFFRVGHYWGGGSQFTYGTSGNFGPLAFFDFHDTTGDGYNQAAVIVLPRFQTTYRSGSDGCVTVPNPTYLTNGDFEPLYSSGGTGLNGNKTWAEWFGDNQWHKVRISLVGNSGIGVSDGVYKVVIDDTVILNRTNIAWADDGTCDVGAGHQPAQSFVGWNCFAIGGNMFNRALPVTDHTEISYSIDDLKITTVEAELDDSPPTYDQPTISIEDTDAGTSTSGTITGTYTIDSELTVGLCTWDHGVNTGFAIVSGGVVSGTVTGLLEGATTVSFSLLDSENQEATDTAVFTQSSPQSNQFIFTGSMSNGVFR